MILLQEFLHAHSIDKKDLILDSTFRNIKTEKFKGWYIGEESSEKYRVTFCDWRTKNKQTFSEGFTDKDNKDAQKQFKILEKERIELQKRKKLDVQREWAAVRESTGVSKYLLKKGITANFGARSTNSRAMGFDLLIPMYNSHGELINMQRIQEDGFKSFVPGAEVDGAFFKLDGPWCDEPNRPIFICEGFATACSVQMAMPKTLVVCAFSAGNLEEIAVTMRLAYQNAKIVIAGDNDWEKWTNIGVVSAEIAAKAIHGHAWIAFGIKGTDWNDFHQELGVEQVSLSLEESLRTYVQPTELWLKEFMRINGVQEAETTHKDLNENDSQLEVSIPKTLKINLSSPITAHEPGLVPLPLARNKQGKIDLPPDPIVVDALLEYFGHTIVRCEDTLFHFKDNYWQQLEPHDEYRIQLMISTLLSKEANTGKIEACFRLFKRAVKPAPRNMFEPQVSIINFLNGTLHVEYRGEKWGMRFADHSYLDLCTNIIPIEYDASKSKKAPEFISMLERILAHDSESERASKLRAIQQMYGACLAPMFPHLFLFHGPGGTGKTSLIIPAQKIIGQKNLSAVDPNEFEGFNLESMIGKTVNISLDIDTQIPIADAIIKRIEDRLPVRINRKFQRSVLAPLPAVHIFVGNKIPATYEKGSGAHRRRWTFIEIKGFKAEGNYSKSFAHDLFEREKEGILNFAIEGLEDLLRENGHFFIPDSSKRSMRRWEMENDSVALFVQELLEGEVNGLRTSEKHSVSRLMVWSTFCDWYDESYKTKPKLGKIKFYEALLAVQSDSAKFEVITVEGIRKFRGVATPELIIKEGAF